MHVGVHCQIDVHSPSTTICIARMEPCEEKLIHVQLPVTCMAMGPVGQQAAFDTLIVALDSCDELLECDELNNVRILKRCDIVVAVAETPVAAQPAPVPAPAPAPGVATPPAPEAPVEKESSPLDDLDLDNLQLDNVRTLRDQI